ncbi:glycoside hydrolase family 2 protein [Flavisericum labens]|uniref:glycoside hydrolase family 2 protein n=1 Tax=Flavisericum labens TaxID=3377112 RepID=UPI00387B7BD2
MVFSKHLRKIKILFFIIILTPFGLTHAQDVFISNTQNRTYTSLNGKWEYILDRYQTGRLGFMPIYKNAISKDKTDRVEYSFDSGQTLWVPGNWNSQKPELTYYEGNIWYKRTFNKNNIDPNKRYFINIGAANYITTVTFNGEILGKHEGGFTPFSFEITGLLKAKDNFLIIGVNNTRKPENIPAEVTDWFNHGGIIRDVKLIEVPKTFIGNYFIALDKSTLNKRTKKINGKIELVGDHFPESAKIKIPELNVNQIIKINPNGITKFSVEARNIELWSPEIPKLYQVILETGADTLEDQIGFRTIETVGKQILLNGKPIFLRGICLHDENPLRKDRANTIEDAKLMLDWAEQLGCNFLRLAHYPHQENIVRLADQKGILLWEELPLYWGIQWGNPEVLKKAKQQYSELINRDYNRACSIIWSIANETAPNEKRTAFLSELADYIRGIDNTRLISAAIKKDQEKDGHPDSVYTYNDPLIEKLDIISLNEYLGWYGGLPEEAKKKSFTSSYEKPIIISEFGSGALQGFHADKLTRWSEEFQEYHYKESIAMFDKIDGLAGMTPWILVDFMSPLRQLRGVQDGWNRKGVISEKGQKKKAFYVLQDYYKTKE